MFSSKALSYLGTRLILFFLVLALPVVLRAQVPVVSTVIPNIAKPGDTVTITGSGFNGIAANNVVFFGSVPGSVTNATATQLKVVVGMGAIFGSVSVLNITTGKMGYQRNGKFLPSFRSEYFIQDTVNFRNRSSFATGGQYPYITVIGDLDGDGKPDLVSNNKSSNTLSIYKNASTPGWINGGSFTQVVLDAGTPGLSCGNQPSNVRLADIDGDGRLDILSTQLGTAQISAFRNTSSTGSISFASLQEFLIAPTGVAPFVIGIADFDNDGRPDIAVTSRDSQYVVILRNTSVPGSINFAIAGSYRTGASPIGVCTGDFDNDGWFDIGVADTQGHSISIFRNLSSSGTLSFADRLVLNMPGNPIDVQCADLDGDGRLDVVTDQVGYNKLTIFKNTSIPGTLDATSFGPAVEFSSGVYPAGIGIGDLNGDAKPDIVVGNASGSHISMFLNHAAGGAFDTTTLSRAIDFNTIGFIFSASVGDLDGDSYPDVIATNANVTGSFHVLRNYPLPPIDTIAGPRSICVTSGSVTYTDAVSGGVWAVSNAAVATVDSVTGVLTPVSAGTITLTYYTIAGGDSNSRRLGVTVDAFPSAAVIAGTTTTVCTGARITLTDAVAGGIWSISDPAVASVGAVVTGTTVTLTGVGFGPATLSYSLTNTCGTDVKTQGITVNAPPDPGGIIGARSICGATTTNLTTAGAPGGVWTSSVPSVATVGTDGVVHGVSAPGVTTISYTVSNSCGPSSVSLSFTVNVAAFAGSISGPSTVCAGASTTLTDPAPDGVWSSSDTTKARVNSTGVVTGVSAGAVNIKYKVTNSCNSDSTSWPMTVNPAPVAGTITGADTVCATTTTTLTVSGASGSGTWSSSASAIASVNSSGSVRGNSAGVAVISYSVTSGLGCGTAVAAHTVSVIAQPVAGTITGTATVCAGLQTTLANTAGGGVWSSGSTGIATVNGSGVVSGVSAGNAIISYTVSNYCNTVRATRTVTVNAQPNAGTITGFNTICEGQVQSLTNTATGGSWTTSAPSVATVSNTGAVTALTPGNTTITYTSTNTCGTATDTQAITVNPLAVTGTITDTSRFVCAGFTLSLSNTVSTGSWSSSNTSVATVGSTGLVSAVSGGVAIISYSVTNGCGTRSDTQAIRVNPQPDAGAITGGFVVCEGQSLTLNNTAIGGAWSSTAPGVASISASGVVRGLAGGTTIVSYTVTNACNTAVDTQMITVNPLPVVSITAGATSVCAGTNITLTNATPGGVWATSNAARATVTGGVVAGLAAGTVIISYTLTNGCGAVSDTMLITVLAQPVTGTITGANSLCTGTNITLSGAAPGGTWSSSDNTVATVAGGTVRGVAVGVAVITYTVTNSCNTAIDTQLVHVQLSPDAGHISGPIGVCAGGASITLHNIATTGTWSSSNTSIATVSDSTVTGITAGNTIISYTVVNSCGTAVDTQLVVVNPLPVAGTITGASAVCTGTNITLSASLTGGVWGAANGNATVVAGVVHGVTPGMDTITYSKTNGCGTDVAMKVVTVELTPVAGTIAGPANVCAGQSVTLSETVTGGTWSASNARATVSDSLVTGVSQGSVTISYSVSNSCGAVHATHSMIVDTLPVAGVLSGPPSVCTGTDITITASVAGGAWSATNTNATVSGGVVSGVTLGADTIVYTTTNICGTNFTIKGIVVNNSPYVDTIVGASAVCEASVILLTNTITGGVWTSADTAIATVNTEGVVTGIAGGVTTISYAVTTVCGTATATHAVTVNPLPGAGVITGPAHVCLGFAITLHDTATGGIWSASNATATIAGNVVTGVTPGVDTITYTVINSCGTAVATYAVTVDPLSDTGTITGAPMVCQGSAISLTNTVAGGTWSSSVPAVATVSATGVVTGLLTGDAVIMYTPGSGCNTIAAHHAVSVHVVPALVSAVTAPAICDSTTFSYVAESNVPAASLQWQRAAIAGISNAANSGSGAIDEVLDNTIPYPVTVVYTYTVAAAGCADTVAVSVTVKPTPKLSGSITQATCGAVWFNYTPSSLTPGTSFAWTRPAVAGIVPATSGGTGVIHDSVVNTLGGSLTATYVFTLTANGCTGTEDVHVVLSEGAHQPHITTHSPSILCAATQFQNFGTTDTTATGELFTWSTSGEAVLWAAGTGHQYCLVNFTTAGLGWVYLQNTQTSSGCALRDSFAVYVTGAENEHPSVTRFEDDFVCEANNEDHYQWGYDDAITLDSMLLAGETNQSYYEPSPDYAGKYYWVMTTHHGCMQKTYYNVPTAIINISAVQMVLTAQPNPNNGAFSIVLSAPVDQQVRYSVTDMTGKTIREWTSWTNRREQLNMDVAPGLYFVSATSGGQQFTEKVVVVR